jgi:hypothetical protein
MLTRLKQLFCFHNSISTTTETSSEGLIISKSIIECERCHKTFAQHPRAQCCYVMHLHGEILRDQCIKQIKKFQQ